MAEREGTLRERLREALAKEALTTQDLSRRLSVTEREVEAALPHVARSVKASGDRWEMRPPECAACGFVFEERSRARKPSRCPQCRATRVRPPRFAVRAK